MNTYMNKEGVSQINSAYSVSSVMGISVLSSD